ncbi:MAG: hypothetical protein QOD58_3030 [Mycobacterium sp.]|nr:hypothetical protein [Mycobacterium sp.]
MITTTAVNFENPDALFPPKDVAEFRHTTVGALAQERFSGTGPAYVKCGARVFYRAADLADYIAANTIRPESGAAQRD